MDMAGNKGDKRRTKRQSAEELAVHGRCIAQGRPRGKSSRRWVPADWQAFSVNDLYGLSAPGEDIQSLVDAFFQAPQKVKDESLAVLTPGQHQGPLRQSLRDAQTKWRLLALQQGRLKRLVVSWETAAGPRVVKLYFPGRGLRRLMAGLRRSPARKECANHLRAMSLGLHAADVVGFARTGIGNGRAMLVQKPLPSTLLSLDQMMAQATSKGDGAAQECAMRFAKGLAHSHHLGFFHADLKGFHGFMAAQEGDRIRWLDLGRVGFGLSERQRQINLYQMFRYVLPADEKLQRLFVSSYWQDLKVRSQEMGLMPQRKSAEQIFEEVKRLLERKMQSHPNPRF